MLYGEVFLLLLLKDRYYVTLGLEVSSADSSKRVRSVQPTVREGRKRDLAKCLAFMENFILARDM